MSAPRELIEQYRTAFTRADVSALVGCFAFPLHVVAVADGSASMSVAHLDEWPRILERLLSAYKRLGVTDCVPLTVEITEPMEAVAVAHIHWGLQRERCQPVYEFTALYTLVVAEGGLRIAAITHDELPKLQAALQGF